MSSQMQEEALGDAPESAVTQAPPRTAVELRVGMKTFGTRHYLNMLTTNVSANGMLLRVDDPKEVAPFQNKTLLELVFYPDGKYLDHEIKAMGVVVRFIVTSGKDARKEQFGVRVVDAADGYEDLIGSIMKSQEAA